MNKPTHDQVKAALEIKSTDPGVLTLSKGAFTYRKEYYWRPKKDPETCFAHAIEKLNAAGLVVVDPEYGDNYARFQGNKGVKHNSHYWFKFKVVFQPDWNKMDPVEKLEADAEAGMLDGEQLQEIAWMEEEQP